MYRLLHNGLVFKHSTLQDALLQAARVEGEWSVLAPNGDTIWDWQNLKGEPHAH